MSPLVFDLLTLAFAALLIFIFWFEPSDPWGSL